MIGYREISSAEMTGVRRNETQRDPRLFEVKACYRLSTGSIEPRIRIHHSQGLLRANWPMRGR